MGDGEVREYDDPRGVGPAGCYNAGVDRQTSDRDPQTPRDLAGWAAYADSRKDPCLAEAIRFVIANDPDVLEMVADVDRSLIRFMLKMKPIDRMAYAADGMRTIEELRGGRR